MYKLYSYCLYKFVFKKAKKDISKFRYRLCNSEISRGRRGAYPTIQTTTPTREIRRDKKAKGRPNRNPSGLHLQSSEQQHMLQYLISS